MEKDKIKLEDAIRDCYEVSPLRGDLAASVLKQIAVSQKPVTSWVDKGLIGVAASILLASFIYVFTLPGVLQASMIGAFVTGIGLLGLISWKEMQAIKHKARALVNGVL